MKDTFQTCCSTSAFMTFIFPIVHYFAAILQTYDSFGFCNWIYKVSGSMGLGFFLMYLWQPGFEPFKKPLTQDGKENRAYEIASIIVMSALFNENFLFDSFLDFG